MEIVGVLSNQIIMMFLLMAVGLILFKTKKLSLEGSRSIGNVLLYVVIPAVVIKAYLGEKTEGAVVDLVLSFALSLIGLAVAMLISSYCFKKDPIEKFGAAFSNAGFIGIPIVSVLYGDQAVFYVSAFVAFVNIFQWTYGVWVLTGDTKSVSIQSLVSNPFIISLMIGLGLWMTGITLPIPLHRCIESFANMNAPLAMLSLGTYLAQIPFKEVFSSQKSWLASGVRLVIIPIITLAIFSIIPIRNEMIKTALLIVAATPIGSNVAIFAQLYDGDYSQAVKDVCLSTLCCIVTLPVLMMIMQWVW